MKIKTQYKIDQGNSSLQGSEADLNGIGQIFQRSYWLWVASYEKLYDNINNLVNHRQKDRPGNICRGIPDKNVGIVNWVQKDYFTSLFNTFTVCS